MRQLSRSPLGSRNKINSMSMKYLDNAKVQSPYHHMVLRYLFNFLIIVFGLFVFVLHFTIQDSSLPFDTLIVAIFLHVGFIYLIYSLAIRDFIQWKKILGNLFLIGSAGIFLGQLFLLWQLRTFSPITVNHSIFRFMLILTIFLIELIIGITLRVFANRISNAHLSQDRHQPVPNSEGSVSNYRQRALACLLDYGIFFVLFWILLFIFGEPVTPKDPSMVWQKQGSNIVFLIAFWGWFVYFPFIEALTGQTLGKVAMDIQVVRENSYAHPLRVSLIRHAFDPIDIFFFGLIGTILVSVTSKHKRLGDFFAGSRVIRKQPVTAA